MGAKIYAHSDTIFQLAFVRESFSGESSFLDVKEAHLKALVKESLSSSFLTLLLVTIGLALAASAFVCSGKLGGI